MVMKLVSGSPFTVTNGAGVDLNLDSFTETRAALNDPSVLGRSVSNPATSQSQLPRDAFRAATAVDYGCCLVGRNTFFAAGVRNFDIGIAKYFRMPFEGHRLMFRADLFNAFNRVQYGLPSSDITPTNTNFGKILGTSVNYSPRTIQVVLRYTF